MKKALVCLLAVLLCLGMAACGEDKGSSSSQESSSSQQSSSQDSSSSQESSDSQGDASSKLLEVTAEEFRTAFNSKTEGAAIGDWYSNISGDSTTYVEDLGNGVTIVLFEDNASKKVDFVTCSADLVADNMDGGLFVNSMVAMVMAACPGADEMDAALVLDGLKLVDEEESAVWDLADHTEIYPMNGYVFSLTLKDFDWTFMIMAE